ncbi:MAG: hypothetical protein U0670_03460 [Anaerolineae bacterium]
MTVVFLGLLGVLIDPDRVRAVMPQAYGRVLAARYGGDADFWAAAVEQVRADWDSYYADLDLAGEEGVEAMWEGLFRITRAIFRLAERPEPPKPELTTFARQLPAQAFSSVNCAYPDAIHAVHWLNEACATIPNVFASLSNGQISGLLIGADLRQRVGTVMGMEWSERFRHDVSYWQTALLKLNVDPGNGLVIDTLEESIEGAAAAGMRVFHFARTPSADLSAFVRGVLA